MSLRTRPSGQWSLKDTYGFIASYVEAHAQMPAYAQKRPALRPAQPASSQALPAARPIVTNRKARATAAVASSSDHPRPPHNGPSSVPASHTARRDFHNYFVTHLPSSSMHPDSRVSMGSHHKLPRSAATRHVPSPGSSPAAAPPNLSSGRDLTVVRIPLRSAKHHFGIGESRGQRPYNEDTYQAGTIDMPAFAKRPPISLVRSAMKRNGEGTSADSVFGDPQVFYFAVFDGHGGTQCSDFLREELHGYIEEAANEFELKSSVKSWKRRQASATNHDSERTKAPASNNGQVGPDEDTVKPDIKEPDQVPKDGIPRANQDGMIEEVEKADAVPGSQPKPMNANVPKAIRLQEELVKEYKATVGGYFRRFNPPHFTLGRDDQTPKPIVSIETVLTYAFLRADLDFITAQARKPDPDDPYVSDSALNDNEILGSPSHMPPLGHGLGGGERFKGGSTASVALISTPTPSPYWHPAATSTLLVGHVGDSRVLLCDTSTGLAVPLTSDHHPSSPGEAQRLRRYAASFVTDSFGEERIQGLANSRAFGDMGSKRLGVSAEPEITRTEMGPAQYSFLVLMSDGVSGTLSDQEIVDVVKEAKTPEQGSRDVVSYATEVTSNGDNTTCLVVRLGGWERRSEGGLGSLGTKEIRDFRRNEANDPRRGRR